MDYKIEFYRDGSTDPMLLLESQSPFPTMNVHDPVAILSERTGGHDEWKVEARAFIFTELRCTTQYWCSPQKRMDAPPKRKAITSLSELRAEEAQRRSPKPRSKK